MYLFRPNAVGMSAYTHRRARLKWLELACVLLSLVPPAPLRSLGLGCASASFCCHAAGAGGSLEVPPPAAGARRLPSIPWADSLSEAPSHLYCGEASRTSAPLSLFRQEKGV